MKILIGLVVIAAVMVGLLYVQGTFDTSKIGPKSPVGSAAKVSGVRTATVVEKQMPVWSEAVGTVRSRRTTRVSPRIMGTILDVTVAQGDTVKKGELLARLDDREVRARLNAAKAELSRAQAELDLARSGYDRTRKLKQENAATEEQLEAATARFQSAKAGVTGAEQAVRAASIVVEYAEIHAPLFGVVSEKLSEPGDLALPGKPILTIQDPHDLRLEADVREYLIPWLSVGAPVKAVFGPPISEQYETKVEERAPEADPITRTFTVKAPLPKGTKAQPGNFGRLRFETGKRKVILAPVVAVRHIGQLETVRVLEEGRIDVRHVRTGDTFGDQVEVLSGLTPGERVVVGR